MSVYDRGLPQPHPNAVGLTAFRALPNGVGRQYTAVEFERGWNGVEHFIRTLNAVGYVRPSTADSGGYAVLDVLDVNGDIVQDYDIPTADAFRYVKRKLRLTVESTDGAARNQP